MARFFPLYFDGEGWLHRIGDPVDALPSTAYPENDDWDDQVGWVKEDDAGRYWYLDGPGGMDNPDPLPFLGIAPIVALINSYSTV